MHGVCFNNPTDRVSQELSAKPAGLSSKSPPANPLLPTWQAVLLSFYASKGATPSELQLVLSGVSFDTQKRYEMAWKLFFSRLFPSSTSILVELKVHKLLHQSLARRLQALHDWFKSVPHWRLALLIRQFAGLTSWHQARNLYSAWVMFPPCQQLRFETALKPAKQAWNASKPKYDWFFDVGPLFQIFKNNPLLVTEEAVRLRAILLLRLAGMYRGVDLERAQRPLRSDRQPWFLWSRKKGRKYFGWYPIPKLQPTACDPQHFLGLYLHMTREYAGSALFLTLPNKGGERASPFESGHN
jgi:hypothetical protein